MLEFASCQILFAISTLEERRLRPTSSMVRSFPWIIA